MCNTVSMEGPATETRWNVKFSPQIPRLNLEHLILCMFSYVITHLAMSGILFLVNIW
jgi:hypothetical protein